jgi:hypothetical protein
MPRNFGSNIILSGPPPVAAAVVAAVAAAVGAVLAAGDAAELQAAAMSATVTSSADARCLPAMRFLLPAGGGARRELEPARRGREPA